MAPNPKSPGPQPGIQITESGSGLFTLTVSFAGRSFECGNYANRSEAARAGRLFVERKEQEEVGQRGRPRRKGATGPR